MGLPARHAVLISKLKLLCDSISLGLSMTTTHSRPLTFCSTALRLRQVALLLPGTHAGHAAGSGWSTFGMTQPAATNMLKELESALGVRLFEREGRGLKITAAGAAVMAHSRA